MTPCSGSNIHAKYQRFAYPREMPRKLIPSRRSDPAGCPQHDRFLFHRKRFVFGLPGLPLLAFRSHLIPIFVDPHQLPS